MSFVDYLIVSQIQRAYQFNNQTVARTCKRWLLDHQENGVPLMG